MRKAAGRASWDVAGLLAAPFVFSARHLIFRMMMILLWSLLSACSIRVGKNGFWGLPSPGGRLPKGTSLCCRSSGTGDQEDHPCSLAVYTTEYRSLESHALRFPPGAVAYAAYAAYIPSVCWAVYLLGTYACILTCSAVRLHSPH